MFKLNEVKYKDLSNLKKIKSVRDVQRAAHSQGYSMSDPKQGVGDHYDVDLKHRKSGKGVTPSRGGKLGGAFRGKNVDTTLVNQAAASIKNDAAARGRVDKTDKPTKERRDKMDSDAAAKRAKQASRPFGGKNERHGGAKAAPGVRSAPKPDMKSKSTERRKKTGWKTFESFASECNELLIEGEFSVMIDE